MREKRDHPVLIAAPAIAGFLFTPQRAPERAAQGRNPRSGQSSGGPSGGFGKDPAGAGLAPASAVPDDGRGRTAHKPSDIPPRGWWDVIKRTVHQISDNQLMTQAAAITFYALLSIFPALAALVSVYGLIADPQTIVDQVTSLGSVLPGGGVEMLTTQLKTLASTKQGLSWALVVGVATSLWSANQGMKALFNALNVVNEEQEKRGFIKLTAITLAFTAGIIAFMVIALAAVVAVPAALNTIGMGGITEALLRWLRWPLLLVLVGVVLAMMYRYGPSREEAKWRWISWGGGVASVAWVIMSLLFSWYVGNFGTYNKTYGSLGAVVGFMTWIWLSSTVVLIGAQLNAELEMQTKRDTTTGPEKPAGQRGATPADVKAPA